MGCRQKMLGFIVINRIYDLIVRRDLVVVGLRSIMELNEMLLFWIRNCLRQNIVWNNVFCWVDKFK